MDISLLCAAFILLSIPVLLWIYHYYEVKKVPVIQAPPIEIIVR